MIKPYTVKHAVKCRYNAVQLTMILHTTLQQQWQKVNEFLKSQHTLQISPSQASFGWSIVNILEKIHRVVSARRCIMIDSYHQTLKTSDYLT